MQFTMGVNKYRITESTLEKIGVVYPRNTVSTKPPPGFLRAIKATKTLTRVFESAHDQHQTPPGFLRENTVSTNPRPGFLRANTVGTKPPRVFESEQGSKNPHQGF